MEGESKFLVLAVDGTAAMGPYWKPICNDYLRKIIKSFCANGGSPEEEHTAVLGLVVYNTNGPDSAFLVQSRGLTRNVETFLAWLSAITFGGGGFNDSAVAEGLAEALMMFPQHDISRGQKKKGRRHCILLAASNPYPLPTPLQLPISITSSESGETSEVQTEVAVADAEKVAGSFLQCNISLSVISPKKFQKLNAIYDAAQGDIKPRRSTDNWTYTFNHPSYLVLISDSFAEARAALAERKRTPTTQGPQKGDVDNIFRTSEPIMSSFYIEDELRTVHQTMSEVTRGPSKSPPGDIRTACKEVPQIEMSTAAGPSLLQHPQLAHDIYNASSPFFPDDTRTEPMQSRHVPLDNIHASTSAAINASVHSKISHTCQAIRPSSLTNRSFADLQPKSPLTPIERMSQTHGSPGHAPVFNAPSPNSLISQQQRPNMVQGHNRYVKAWEGPLTADIQGQLVFITKLAAYRRSSSSDALTANWPQTLFLHQLVCQEFIQRIPLESHVDYLIIKASNRHGIFDDMHSKKLCANIRLPTQTFILCATNKQCQLIGTLLHGDVPLLGSTLCSLPQSSRQSSSTS